LETIKLNESDFKFYKKDEPYQDYWFKVNGESKENLTRSCVETGMIEVTEAVYSKADGLAAIKRQFVFGYDVIISDNDKLNNNLKNILSRKINEMEESNDKRENN
jgi:hypothetical protein